MYFYSLKNVFNFLLENWTFCEKLCIENDNFIQIDFNFNKFIKILKKIDFLWENMIWKRSKNWVFFNVKIILTQNETKYELFVIKIKWKLHENWVKLNWKWRKNWGFLCEEIWFGNLGENWFFVRKFEWKLKWKLNFWVKKFEKINWNH